MIDGIGGPGGYNPTQFAQMKEQAFKAADANADGSITKSEFSDALSEKGFSTEKIDTMFNRIDSSGDGSISRLESDTAMEEMKNKMQEMMSMMKSVGGGGQSPSLLDFLQDSESDDSDEDDSTNDLRSYLEELERSGAGSAGNFFSVSA